MEELPPMPTYRVVYKDEYDTIEERIVVGYSSLSSNSYIFHDDRMITIFALPAERVRLVEKFLDGDEIVN